jgi:signal transduction histidine kinase/ligand-binding sensor domain-containing protein
MKILLSVLVGLMLCITSVNADEIKFSERSGLHAFYPDNNVFAMIKDTKGIVWFGTMFGLIMHDGSNYIRFKYDPLDSNSISNDDVISIFEDSKGFLWFGTYHGGLNRYDRKSGTFIRFLAERGQISDNTIWSLTEDKRGIIWAGTESGLNKFENGSWTKVNYGEQDSLSQKIFSLATDEFDNLFIGTIGSGLVFTNRQRTDFTSFNLKNSQQHFLNANLIRKVLTVAGRGVYIGSINKGAYFLSNDEIRNATYRFKAIQANVPASDSNQSLSVFDVADSENTSLFLGTNRGIIKYQINKDSSYLLYKNVELDDKQDFISVLPIGKDIVLTSIYDAGLFQLNFSEKDLSAEFRRGTDNEVLGTIRKFTKYDGKIIAGGKKGLFEFSDGRFNFSSLNDLLKNRDILSLASDNAGNLWIGASNGLMKISKENGILAAEEVLSGVAVNELASTHDSKIYAGTSNGITFINGESSNIIKEFRKDLSKPGSLPEDFILSMCIDKRGNLWAGTYAGVSLLKQGTDEFVQYSKMLNDENTIINNYVYSIIEHQGKMYFGTAGGLSVFDGTSFHNFTSQDGLPDQVVNSLAEYNGKIIVGTNFNISLFDPHGGTFALVKNFGEILNPGSVIADDEGNVYFGCKNGIMRVNTSIDSDLNTERKFLFTRLNYDHDGKKVSVDLSETDEVELEHDALNLVIEYSDLNYGSKSSSTYYYSISEIDKSWNFNGSKTTLELKRLEAGLHDIRMKIVKNNGTAYESDSPLRIIVNPPYYNTVYFYLLVASIASLLLFMMYKYKVRNKIKRALEMERAREEEREKIRYETSRDYHDELGHKLTRIAIYSRNLMREIEQQKDSISKELYKIMETSTSLRESARDLIWSMDPGEDTLYDLVIRIKDFSENLLQDTEIALSVKGITESLKMNSLNMDEKRNLLLIAKEAVNNSVKYSNADAMEINFSREGDFFYISISDNGKGFESETVKEGYGMRSMHARAEKLKAELNVNGGEGNGTSVIVKIKLRDRLKEFSLN